MSDERKAIPLKEAARRFLGMSAPTAYAAAKKGDIPTIRIGNRFFVPVAALDRMLDTASETKETAEAMP